MAGSRKIKWNRSREKDVRKERDRRKKEGQTGKIKDLEEEMKIEGKKEILYNAYVISNE